jgi:hypothetical protein
VSESIPLDPERDEGALDGGREPEPEGDEEDHENEDDDA